MAPRNPRPQLTLLYNMVWKTEHDRVFINTLSNYAVERNITLSAGDSEAITMAKDVVNIAFGEKFSIKYCVGRFKKLQERYQVFGFCLSLTEVEYLEDSNTLSTVSFVWDYLCLKYPLAEAYMIEGEPAWKDLCIIFGPPPRRVQPPRPEIIQVSSENTSGLSSKKAATSHEVHKSLTSSLSSGSKYFSSGQLLSNSWAATSSAHNGSASGFQGIPNIGEWSSDTSGSTINAYDFSRVIQHPRKPTMEAHMYQNGTSSYWSDMSNYWDSSSLEQSVNNSGGGSHTSDGHNGSTSAYSSDSESAQKALWGGDSGNSE